MFRILTAGVPEFMVSALSSYNMEKEDRKEKIKAALLSEEQPFVCIGIS